MGSIPGTYLCTCSADHSGHTQCAGENWRKAEDRGGVEEKPLPKLLSVRFITEGLLIVRGKAVCMNLFYGERRELLCHS